MGIYDGNPCGGCEKPVRHPGCHADCQKRAVWKERVDFIKEGLRKEREKDIAVKDLILSSKYIKRKER